MRAALGLGLRASRACMNHNFLQNRSTGVNKNDNYAEKVRQEASDTPTPQLYRLQVINPRQVGRSFVQGMHAG